MLTAENEVVTADGDTEVILARGISIVQLRTLAGRTTDAGTRAPTEKEAQAQVGEVPTFGAMIEFTTDQSVANRFGTGGAVITVRIKRKYLTRGSIAECGWICLSTAPFTVDKLAKGRSFR